MKFILIRTLQELEAIRTYWEAWQNHASNDFAQFKLICQLRPEIECPCVIVIDKNNEPFALMVGRLEQTQFAPALGYLKPVRISAKKMTIIHQGLLGQWDEDTALEAVQYLWSLLSVGVADAIEVHYISEHSAFLRALLANGPRLWCEKRFSWSPHWEMNIPDNGEFLQNKVSSKQRWKIGKRYRELEAAFPGLVSWHWMNYFDDIPGLCTRLEAVAALTYQRGLGAGFVDDEEHRRRLTLFSSQERLRVQILEIEGIIRAFWIGTVYRGVFYSSATGYDPDLRLYEPGTLVFVKMADELAREGVRKLDFGLGDAIYKQRFGDQSWQEGTVWLFAPTAKGLVLRSILRLFNILDSTVRKVLQKMRLTDKLKTIWRRRVSKIEMGADKSESDT